MTEGERMVAAQNATRRAREELRIISERIARGGVRLLESRAYFKGVGRGGVVGVLAGMAIGVAGTALTSNGNYSNIGRR